jgi:23S rRNA (cytosine1962-C5)-methyltransferase
VPRLILKPGREKSLLRRHPWIFSGAIERCIAEPRSGDTLAVHAADGRFLAHATWSPKSQIQARVWSFNHAEVIDATFFRERIAAAIARRRALPELRDEQALRLVHGESDGLPGVVADRYGDTVVFQLTSAGAEAWREPLVEAVQAVVGCACVFERSDGEVRGLEGLPERTGLLHGRLPDPLVIEEHGLRYRVDVVRGHKTGFYLDQRDNRCLAGALAAGRSVLNCFCYSGGFSLQALRGGATSVLSIDSSAEALALARGNAELNGMGGDRCDWLEADVFAALRRLRDQGRRFDLIVLDPPKFAPTAAHAGRAARAYKDINLLAFKLLNSDGLLMSFSCSGGISRELFQKIVAGAALDAGTSGRILRQLGAGADHPVALAFPEGDYLKGLLCQVGNA